MGHGLKAKPFGRHLVFAAGTGILCFVDLVASMIQDKLKLSMNKKKGSAFNSRTGSRTNKLVNASLIGDTSTED